MMTYTASRSAVTIRKNDQMSVPPLSRWDRLYRSALFGHLRNLSGGKLVLVEDGQETVFGQHAQTGLEARVTVRRPRFYRRVVRGGDLGVAEALLDGDWFCDDLTAFVSIFIRNAEITAELDRNSSRSQRWISRGKHWLRRNTLDRARENIRAHYDLGNEFFALFLDETLSYSCGIFEDESVSMRDASLTKIRRACQQLDLTADDHLLEIGSGWGALAAVAADEFGCRVTTTTISNEQHSAAVQRMRACELDHQIEVLQQDYRELKGRYDKLVSIEMIEAVGHQYFDAFFETCARLLTDDGKMLIQAIVISDAKYDDYLRSVDFIREYIFPGGCLPSISALTQSASAAGNLRLVQLHDFAPHYAETLRRWRARFYENREQIAALGFDERFLRMWEYYLCYCEAAFPSAK